MRVNVVTSIAVIRMECKPPDLHKCGEVTRQVTTPIALYKHSFLTNKGKFFLLHNVEVQKIIAPKPKEISTRGHGR